MNDQTLYELLQRIIPHIPSSVSYHLEGSANPRVQGIPTTVNDLDLVTNDLEAFRNILKDSITSDLYKQSINSDVLVCQIQDQEVEILDYKDKHLQLLNKTQSLRYNDLTLQVFPLKHAQYFYEQIGRQEKADLIR